MKQTGSGESIPELIKDNGAVPGIKVDTGKDLADQKRKIAD